MIGTARNIIDDWKMWTITFFAWHILIWSSGSTSLDLQSIRAKEILSEMQFLSGRYALRYSHLIALNANSESGPDGCVQHLMRLLYRVLIGAKVHRMRWTEYYPNYSLPNLTSLLWRNYKRGTCVHRGDTYFTCIWHSYLNLFER